MIGSLLDRSGTCRLGARASCPLGGEPRIAARMAAPPESFDSFAHHHQTTVIWNTGDHFPKAVSVVGRRLPKRTTARGSRPRRRPSSELFTRIPYGVESGRGFRFSGARGAAIRAPTIRALTVRAARLFEGGGVRVLARFDVCLARRRVHTELQETYDMRKDVFCLSA